MKKLLFMPVMLLALLFATYNSSIAQGRGKAKGHYKAKQEKHYRDNGNHYRSNGNHYRTNRSYSGGHGSKHYHAVRKGGGPPPWAPAHGYRAKQHVYFPDYYTFYDPRRAGYVYWGGNQWVFSTALPSFLVNVNLGRARVQLMNNIPLTNNPYTYFNDYYRQFPPSPSININIPHPPLPGR